jgi:hypothetical protein
MGGNPHDPLTIINLLKELTMAVPDNTAIAHTRPLPRVRPVYFFTTAWLMRCQAIGVPD